MYKYADELCSIGERLVQLTGELGVGDQNPERVTSFCLHGRIVELGSAVLALLKSHDVVGIPHLVRGQLEAYVDLLNLSSQPNYLADMNATYYAKFLQVLRMVSRKGISVGSIDVSGTVKQAKKRLAELKKQGASQLNVSDCFRKAEMVSEYYKVYPYLCSHAHNNVAVLEDRYIDKSKDPYQLRIFSGEIDAELAALVALSVKIPLLSFRVLLDGATGSLAKEHAQLCVDFEEARKKW